MIYKAIKKITVCLFCFVILVAICNIASAEEWNTYRHDSTRSGITTDKLPSQLSLNWTFKPNHAPIPAWYEPAEEIPRSHFDNAYHVTVSNGKVYFGSSVDNKVYALNAVTGEVVWTFFTEGPVRFAPTVWKNRIYFGSDDGYAYCLRTEDGKPLWKYRAGPSDEKVLGNGRMISLWPVRTSILVEDGIVYFGAGVFPYEGIYICALSAEGGKIIWKNDTIGDHAQELAFGGISPQSYLIASENILYVPSGRAMPAAFDRASGEFLYYCPPGGKIGGTWALVSEGELIAGVDASGTPGKVAYDEKTGKKKSDAYAWFPGIDMAITPDIAYIVSNDGIYAIDRKAYPSASENLTALSKERQELGAILTDIKGKLSKMADEVDSDESPVDKLTAKIDEISTKEEKLLKELTCKWQYKRTDLYSLIITDDKVVSGGKNIVVIVSAKTGKELNALSIDGNALGLATSGGNLFVSSEKGPIYCFGDEKSAGKEVAQALNQQPYPDDNLTNIYKSSVEKIISETGTKKGYCLVLDAGVGRLAYEIAKQTDMKIIGIESDPKNVEMAKKLLDSAGLYGSRIVIEQWDLASLPDYFANLIVSDALIASRTGIVWSDEMMRILRPYGGVAYVPSNPSWKPKLNDGSKVRETSLKNMAIMTRGKLDGSGSWTQLYGNPQNTACSDDMLVKAPLGVLWFGEPGPEGMVERHARACSPVAMDGRLFVQGEEIIMAYDAYNGFFLWKRDIPGAVRVRVDVDGGNLAVTENGLYIAAYDKCYRLDPATGETIKTYTVPPSADGSQRRWGYISCIGNTLFGSSAVPLKLDYAAFWKNLIKSDGTWKNADEAPAEYKVQYLSYISEYPIPNEDAREAFQRGGVLWHPMTNFPSWGSQSSPKDALTDKLMASDSVFAMDTDTGKLFWNYQGKRIANITLTIGKGKIFFTEVSTNAEQKQVAFKEKQELIKKGIYEESDEAKLTPEDADVRLVIALDTSTGQKLWENPLELTGCGGDRLGTIYHDGILLFFGSFSNHDGGLFANGSLKWRRITALSDETRSVIWSKPLNYLRRPLLVGNEIIIEPRACDVRTGKIKMRTHPITGEQVSWEFLRPGHCCSITSASPNCIFYRSYCTAIYDMVKDNGLAYFGAIRPGCWINLVPANGLLLFPEASSGCTCSFPLRCSVAMKYKDRPKEWTVFISNANTTPVSHLAVNFGAPGDMKDDKETLWFGYPRPKVGYGVKFDLKESLIQGMGYFSQDFKGVNVENSDKPWLFTSGCLGLLKCELPLIDEAKGQKPDVYSVRLGFIATSGDKIGERLFDIKLQGKVVAKDFDILNTAGASDKSIVKEFENIKVDNNLVVELVPKATNPTMAQAPMINFIEVVRKNALK